MKKLIRITIPIVILLSFSGKTMGQDISTKILTKEPIVSKKVHKVKKPIKKQIKPKSLNFIITYYTNSVRDCGNTKGVSASGLNLVRETKRQYSRGLIKRITYIAVPKGIKFGTKFYIKGIGECLAVDRGGSIKYKYINGKKYMKVDVFVYKATYKQLMKLGKKYATGYVIK
jgi:3D (Asp-Asp-Asp) domain-containing protein